MTMEKLGVLLALFKDQMVATVKTVLTDKMDKTVLTVRRHYSRLKAES